MSATGLPDAPTQAPSRAPTTMTLFLELVINGQPSGQVVPVLVRDGHFLVGVDVLRELHVRAVGNAEGLVAVDQIAGVTVEYDSTAQRLQLMLPPDWLPEQQLGRDEPGLRPGSATGSHGFLLNYDVYASDLSRPGAYASTWTEQRFFGGWGVASNTGVYRSAVDGSSSEYLRYDTRWTYSDPMTVRTLTVGDLVTGTLPWGSAVRMAGIQLARNFTVRPDLVPYPLPRFSGQAVVPSAVDLFINGYKAGGEVVQPGPFTLNTMPFINGAGEASMVTTDALGRQVLTTIPFYVSNTLLKPDTTDYSVALGALRQDYGIKNFSYGQTAASGSYRRGISDAWTLEGRAEGTEGFAALGLGTVAALRHYGIVNFSLTGSRGATGEGQQWSYGYQYSAQRYGLGVQHTQRNDGYSSLGALGIDAAALSLSSTQVNLSASLGQAGAVALAYFDIQGGNGQRTRIATLNYTKPLDNSNFFSVNLSNDLLTQEYNLQLQWTLLLDNRGSVSVTSSRSRSSEGQQIQYSRSPPPSGGAGWNLSYAGTGAHDEYRQASGTWRAASTQLQAGVSAQGRQSATWAGAAGSVVIMDGGIFPSNRINDAFALVSTSGIPGIPVRFENQLVGETDANGHLLVTGVNAYYPSRFEIDTLDLPDYMRAPQSEQRIVLRSGSGAVLRFEIAQIVAASMTLVDERGQPLPVGMLVQHVASGQTTVVGWDGQVYLEGLDAENELVVRGANAPACRVRFAATTGSPTVLRLGRLVCRPQASFAELAPPDAIDGVRLAGLSSRFARPAFAPYFTPLATVAAGDTP